MRVFKFAEFILIESERALFRGGQAVNLAPKVFDTLLILIKNHGHVVSKNDLMNEVWQDTFVEENNLTQYIFILRKTLGEDHEGRKFIETVPRYGYRFTGDVKEIEADDDSGAAKKVYEVESSIKNEETSAVHTPTAFAPAKLFGSRLILISVSLLLIILVAVSFVNRPDAKGKIWSPNQIKFKRLTESGDLFGAAISADGNSLVYVTRGKQSQLRLKNILTDSEIIIAQSDSGSFNSPHFSPDGNFIFYSYGEASANGAAYRVPVLGGESVRIAENLYSEFSVSPDGRYIAFPRKDEAKKTHEIIIAETNGNGERVAATCAEPEYFELWGPAPAWSRDGARLTVSKGTFGVDGKYLVEFNLANGEEKELPLQDKWYYIARLEWAGKTDLIISGQKEIGEKTQLWQIDFPVGAATRVTNDLTEYDTLDLTGDAQRLVATQTAANYHLWLFDREKNQSRQLTFGENHTDGIAGVAFMPDGRILYTAREKREYDIFSINTDGGDVRQLTKNAGHLNLHPDASPDSLIAFTSDRSGAKRIWLMNTDGSNAKQLTPASDDSQAQEDNARFSPDGQWIYYTLYQSGHGSVYKIAVSGGAPTEVLRDRAVPVISPDGKEITINCFDASQPKQWQLRVRSLKNLDAKDKSLEFPALFLNSAWLPGEPQTLITAGLELDGNNLWQTNLKTGERQKITDFQAERLDQFAISPDGKQFVVSRGLETYNAVLIE